VSSKSNRLKADPAIANRSEFERLLNDIATDQILRDGLVIERDAQLAEIRETSDQEIGPIEARMKAALIRAEKYAETHRDELFPGKLKSAETGLTIFGFRLGQPTLSLLNKKWSWEEVIKALKAKGLAQFVVTTEKPDKDGLKAQLNDEQLASVGARISQSEAFYVEPKRDAAPEQRLVGEGKGVAA
jgi:phage host-nuclease inhibitor protein Gam